MGTRTWPTMLAEVSGGAPRGQRASSQRTPRSLPPWKRSSRASRVTTMAGLGQPPCPGRSHQAVSPKGSTWVELPASGVVLTAPRPNPEQMSREQSEPGLTPATPPRVRLSPYRDRRVFLQLAAHAGTPCPPGATLMAASCPAHAGRGCTRELGHVRPVRLRARRTCPPSSSGPLRPVTPQGPEATPQGHSTRVRGSRPQRKAAFTEGTWPCSPEGRRPRGGFLGPGSSRCGQTSPNPDPDTEEKRVLT